MPTPAKNTTADASTPNQFLLDLAIKNGAQAALHKTVGIGNLLDQSILKAILRVQVAKRLVS